MACRRGVVGWLIVVVAMVGLAMPVAGQDGKQEPESMLAVQFLLQLASSGEFFDEPELIALLDEFEERFGADNPQLSRILYVQGMRLHEMGKYRESRIFFERLVANSVLVFGHSDHRTLAALSRFAEVLTRMGEFSRSLEIHQDLLESCAVVLGTDHPDTLTVKTNLAANLRALGRLADARQHEEEVLSARNRLFGADHPGTLSVKANLAATLRSLGAFEEARKLLVEVLAIRYRTQGEEHPDSLIDQGNLAVVLYDLGDLSGSRKQYEKVLDALVQTLGAEHPRSLVAKANLAVTLASLGELEEARKLYEEVLEVRVRTLGEEHPATLTDRANLARTLMQLGDLISARSIYQELVVLRTRLLGPEHKPSTEGEAIVFFGLARTLRKLGQLNEARTNFLRGLDALEAQVLRVDISEESQSQFREQYAIAYREIISTDLERDQPDEAFLLLERYRTQSLLNLFRWSHPDIGVEIPEGWRIELAEIAHNYDRITRQLDQLYPESDPDLDAEQARLRRRREVIQGQIIELRREAEGIPNPPGLDEICQALDPGSVLLAYSVGTSESQLFVLSHEHGIEVHPIESDASQLWTQVGRLRTHDLADGGEAAVEDDIHQSRKALAQWLYDKLLRPVSDRVDGAERVLVLPDGPLYYLPFPALTQSVEPSEEDPRGWQYLAEWKPFHTVQSATVYAELQERRPDSSDTRRPVWQWVGFGNPSYPSPETADGRSPPSTPAGSDGQPTDAPWSVLRSTTDRGIWDGLSTLHHTQREIEQIQAQFPEGQAKAFLDREATEDEARKLLGNTRIAHFAAHGLADPDYPLDSFLALSLLEGEEAKGRDLEHNGLLQAWEIIDHLQLDADLVVLSACVTAFGPERGGEGLISLSRAFQIAGARSVLASLWAVNDQSTSELMIRFYRNLLEKGMTKDVALQQAQIELIRGPIETVDRDGNPTTRDFSAPYHWAAFQLIGDWQ